MQIRTKMYPESAVIGLLMLITGVLVYLFFGPVIHHPNNYLMAAGGDGLKTYYSSAWYVTYNPDGFTHTGFAYPFGNHMVYADLNPALSIFLRFVNHHLVDISRYVVGITNLTLILSFFPCAFFVYLILRRTLIPQGFALVFALAITWLSPQIDRFTGHYALSYLFFVPMLWYFLIRIFERRYSWLWAGLFMGALIFFEFAHPYHYLIGAVFLFSYLFVYAVQHYRSFGRNLRFYLGLIFVGVLPIVILKGWELVTTETGLDFVKYPYGFLHYTAGFETLFIPWKPTSYNPSPFWEPWHYLGIWEWVTSEQNPRDPMEGSAYVGFVGLLALGAVIWRLIGYLWRRQFVRITRPVLPTALRTGLWAAVLMLILASALPFRIFPQLLEWFDFVRQFRSLGRLAWPFYYTFMTFSAYLLYTGYRLLRRHTLGTAFWKVGMAAVALAVLSWALDARVLTKRKRDYFLQNAINPNYPDWRAPYKDMLEEKGFKPEDFQAILAFPFYHVGSEKIAMEGWNASFYSKAVSLSTGLPIVNNYTARAPLSSSMETIQLAGHPYLEKELPAKFPNEKPLLLIYTYPEEEAPFREKYLLDQSTFITRHSKVRMASLPVSAFQDQQEQARAQYFARKQAGALYRTGDLYTSEPTDALFLNGYGDAWFAGGRLGGKVKSFPYKGRMLLFEGSLPGGRENLPMEASVWVELDRESNYLPQLICQQFEGEQAVSWDWKEMKTTTDISGRWARVTVDFILLKPDNTLRIFADGDHLNFDNLLIRPKGVDVYSPVRPDGSFIVNNFFISPP